MTTPKPGSDEAAKYDGELTMKWSKRENDFIVHYPHKPDGHLVHYQLNTERMKYDVGKQEHYFEPSFVDELRKRGYDVTTLRFSVKRLAKADVPAKMATCGALGVDGDGREVEQ